MSNKAGEPEIPAPSAAFIEQVTRAQRQLFAFVLSLVPNASDADDVLQETNLVLWRKSAEFEPGTNFDAWAFKVAQFQVMAFRKRQQRSKLHFDDELVELLAVDAAAEFAEDSHRRRNALAACLRRLSPDQRRLLAVRYEPEGCVNDIAAAQGRSPKAVSEALRRIRRTLKNCIESTMAKEVEA